ncbi:vacuolar protein sorting 55 superfamily protein [Thecamonas trahens ATCC 50062]|uniref:Vacuolar protein sorting 55 superfamily protein n=1 Tax=Thecamonas trahens ATCC 50062 TaxID=461836 RepID=A0A0L0DLH3_THETB|nr:vacuolar protein sorting 55 superfamily protein [Thecamonas trahens ATCC 50062]KNC53152.1 vacuolar protein sorting 55 superfamily protein [Thecamonas trahens ATCC 50062]|eukprot:XP_013754625.1 vacuolar protein sorting 55 superfamily protein [Thecamonas trahens ATCC 50062]
MVHVTVQTRKGKSLGEFEAQSVNDLKAAIQAQQVWSLYPSAALIILASLIALSLLFVVLSCVIWRNWLPMVVIVAFGFAPLPNLLCGACQRGSSSGFSLDEGRNGWKDSGFFLTGAIVVTGLALPMTLAHVDAIEVPAMVMAVAGGVLFYTSVLLYSHVFADDEDDVGF